jgi:hypothetical protein
MIGFITPAFDRMLPFGTALASANVGLEQG